MRLLISAYACDPERGSEPGAGWEWTRAAATVATKIKIVTRQKNVDKILGKCAELCITNVEVVGHDLGPILLRLKRLPFGTQLYYLLWQTSLRRRLRRGAFLADVDLVHHLTFATDWMPSGVSGLDRPLVWGPVGGATRVSWRQLHMMPIRHWGAEIFRNIVSAAGRALWGRRVAAEASVILGQNSDEIEAFPHAKVSVHPNVVAEPTHSIPPPPSGTRKAVTVGRLVPLKGLEHIIDALAHPAAAEWTLSIVGEGPSRSALEARARRKGVRHRVYFYGHLPRDAVTKQLEEADVYISASLHEAAGFSVAEAVAAGLHVIYANVGGPIHIVPIDRGTPVSVDRGLSTGIAQALANARRYPPTNRWSRERLPPLLERIYNEALSE